MKARTSVVAATLLAAAAAASADECTEFRNSVDMAIGAEGYDAVVVAFNDALDAWRIVEESNHWNPAANNLIPALAASKKSADAALDARERMVEPALSMTGAEDREQAEIATRSLDDLYHKTMAAFFELVFFAHCGDQSH